MKISTRGRYGLRAMIDLAVNQRSKAIPLREISERQNISEQYLEQLFASLRKAGLVNSVRGAHGGYVLNYKPEKITVGDIIRTLEGPIAPVDCVLEKSEECKMIDSCVTKEVWDKIKDNINEVLDSITLDELKEKTLAMKEDKTDGLMYHI